MKKNQKGFTLVELIVVLVILGILMGIAAPSLSAYTRQADFNKNESNAKTLYLAAQSALTHYKTSGQLEAYLKVVENTGHRVEFGGESTDKRAGRIRAIRLNKGEYAGALMGDAGAVVRLLENDTYDKSLLDASICLEIDMESGQVYAVFYSSSATELSYEAVTPESGAATIAVRDYEARKPQNVGYYSVEDVTNVVDLRLTKLRINSLTLLNSETLTLNWGGNSRHQDLDVVYDIELCRSGDNSTVFSTRVDLAKTKIANGSIALDVAYGGSTASYRFPMAYDGKQFSMTLDAVMSAQLMAGLGGVDINRSSNYSITRFGVGAESLYAKVKVSPNANSLDDREYAPSSVAKSNSANALFGDKSKMGKDNLGKDQYEAQLTTCRHLSNIRYYPQGAEFTVAVRSMDWSGKETTLYDLPENGGGLPQAIHGGEPRGIFPTIPTLAVGQTLNGDGKTIRGLRLGNASVYGDTAKFLGLVGENKGTIRKLTLEGATLLVNLTPEEAKTAAENGTAPDTLTLPGLRGVGLVCGSSRGTLTGIAITRDAALTAAVNTGNNKDIPSGIGGVAGILTGAGASDIQTNAAVVGVLADQYTGTGEESPIEDWYIPAGIGGVVGYCGVRENGILRELSNSATVGGNMFVGGVAGNLENPTPLNPDIDWDRYPPQVSACHNSGQVLCTAKTQPNEKLPIDSREGLFTGGILGYGKNVVVEQCTSAPGTAQGFVFQGDAHKGLLRGNYVGGIQGYSQSGLIRDCATKAGGYVLGNNHVGGIAGGLSQGTGTRIRSTGQATVNACHVIGNSYVGGIVGENGPGSVLHYCTNNGVVAGTGSYIGGIVGANVGTDNAEGMAKVLYCTSYLYDHNDTIYNMVVNQWKAYGDYAGGIAGYNEYGLVKYNAAEEPNGNAGILKENMVATIVTGKDFVGGVVGANGPHGLIDISSIHIIGGKIHATGDCVGGYIGLNTAESVLSQGVAVQPYRVDGRYCVGGVIGANLVAPSKDNTISGYRTQNALASIRGQGLCGGLIGYNRLVGTSPSMERPLEINDKGLIVENHYTDSKFTMTLTDGRNTHTLGSSTNNLSIRACAYGGGILGYNAPGTKLTLTNCVNSGTIARYAGEKGMPLTNGVSLNAYLPGHTFPEKNLWGAMVGGIVGVNTQNSLIQNCQNQGDMTAEGVLGGIVGLNEGGIENCAMTTNIGNSQLDYVGGIAGINAGNDKKVGNSSLLGGTILDCTTAQGKNVTGRNAVGGITGANLEKAQVRFTTAGGKEPKSNILAQGTGAGGVAGENYGGISLGTPLGQSPLTVTGKNQVGGIAGYNGGGSITGEGGTGAETSDKVTVLGTQYVGGLVGENRGNLAGTSNSPMINRGTVRAYNGYSGGVLGRNAGGRVSYAQSYGTVSADRGSAGGIAAENQGAGTLEHCVDYGNVIANNGYAGGIVAQNEGTLQQCTVEPGKAAGGVKAAMKAGRGAGVPYIQSVTFQEKNGTVLTPTGDVGNMFDQKGDTDTRVENNDGGSLWNNSVTGSITLSQPVALSKITFYIPTIPGGTKNVEQSMVLTVCDEKGNTIVQTKVENPSYSDTVKLDPNRLVSSVKIEFNSVWTNRVQINEFSMVDSGGTVLPYGEQGGGEPEPDPTPEPGSLTISATGVEEIGAIAGVNSGTIYQCNVTKGTGKVTLAGTAGTVGTLAGVNRGTIRESSVEQLAAIFTKGRLLTVGGGAGRNEATGTIINTSVVGDFVGFSNYQYLGGVAGENLGTLEGCAYSGSIEEAGSGMGRCYGGMAGINGQGQGGAVIKDCRVTDMKLTATGIYTAGGSQTAAQKEAASSHMGGIAGKNEAEALVEGCQFAAGDRGKNGIQTQAGTIGGIVGYNKGSIRLCGYEGTKGLMMANGGGEIASGKELRDNAAGKGIDKNTVASETNYTMKLAVTKNGHAGGITGFNAPSGRVEYCASGRWFVSNSSNTRSVTCGGIIGQNEADGDSRFLLNQAYVLRKIDSKDTDRFAGGIIGNQENRTSSSWSIYGCVNYGKVKNENSHYSGGIIGQWSYNGGTLEDCYNYGDLQTTVRSDTGHGAAAGMAAILYHPTSGQVFNIFSCQNHGNIYGPDSNNGGRNTNGGNDCAGILGNVSPYNQNENVYINLVDCVNGQGVEIYAGSMAAGMVSYLSNAVGNACERVVLRIDRCRNYAKVLQGRNQYLCSGILGDRYAGKDNTVITNCFSVGEFNNPITYSRKGETINPANCKGNYYIDEKSIKGVTTALGASAQTPQNDFKWPDKNDASRVGNRLYLGSNTDPSAAEGKPYYAVLLRQGLTPKDVTENHALNGDTMLWKASSSTDGKVLLRYPTRSTGPAFTDIPDEAIQAYYQNNLDNKKLDTPEITGVSASGYDYTVSWKPVENMFYYEMEVYLFETAEDAEKGKLEGRTPVLSGLKYFEESGTFPMSPQWTGKYYRVRVKAHSMEETNSSNWSQGKSGPFKKAMVTPLLRGELVPNGKGWQYRYTLENAHRYTPLGNDWQVKVWFTDPKEAQILDATHSQVTFGAQGENPLRGQAFAMGTQAEEFFPSAMASVPSYTPGTGLPQGSLGAVSYRFVGTTMDTLRCEVSIPYNQTGGTTVSMPPNYWAELVNAKGETVAKADTMVSGGATVTAELRNLPKDLLSSGELSLRCWFANTGLGPIYTYHPLAEGETTPPNITESEGLGGGKYYSVVLDKAYQKYFEKYISTMKTTLPTLLPAPVLEPAEKLVPTFDDQGKMQYTFTWDAGAGDDAQQYEVALTGIAADGTHVAIDTQTAYPVANNTQKTFTMEAEDWNYSKVMLQVTRLGSAKGDGTAITVGSSSVGQYQISQRLPQIPQPGAVSTGKNDLFYDMTWVGVPEESKPFAGGYRLWAAERTNPPVCLNPNPEKLPEAPLIPMDSVAQQVDLEAFGGKTIQLYVTVISQNKDRYQDSAPGVGLTVEVPKRMDAPQALFLPSATFGWAGDKAATVQEFATTALELNAYFAQKLNGSYIVAALVYESEEAALADKDLGYGKPTAIYGGDSTLTMGYIGEGGTQAGMKSQYQHVFQNISAQYAGRWVVFQLRSAADNATSSPWVYSGPVRLTRVKLDKVTCVLDSIPQTLEGLRYKLPNFEGESTPLKREAKLRTVTWGEAENAGGYQLVITPKAEGETPATPLEFSITQNKDGTTTVTQTVDGTAVEIPLKQDTDPDGKPVGGPYYSLAGPSALEGATQDTPPIYYQFKLFTRLYREVSPEGKIQYRLVLPDTEGTLYPQGELHTFTSKVAVTAKAAEAERYGDADSSEADIL